MVGSRGAHISFTHSPLLPPLCPSTLSSYLASGTTGGTSVRRPTGDGRGRRGARRPAGDMRGGSGVRRPAEEELPDLGPVAADSSCCAAACLVLHGARCRRLLSLAVGADLTYR